MDLFGLNPAFRKEFAQQNTFTRVDASTHDVDTELAKFPNNELLSSSAWSSVIHQPSQDSEPEDLPSTVDINAIKDSSTPLATSTLSSGQTTGDDSENHDSDSDSETDSESGNNENAESGADSGSCSDSDSISSHRSSCSSRGKANSCSSIISHSPVSNLADSQQRFSVQENNFDQGGLKLKLSALKLKNRIHKTNTAEDHDCSSDSSGTDLAVKRRTEQDSPVNSCSIEIQKNLHKFSSITNQSVYAPRSSNRFSYHNQESESDSSSSSSDSLLKYQKSAISRFSPKFDKNLNKKSNPKTLRNDISSRTNSSKSIIQLPRTCQLSEDSDDSDKDLQSCKPSHASEKCLDPCRIPKQTKEEDNQLKNNTQIDENTKNKLHAKISDSNSSSDAELLPKQIVRDAINSIHLDSDSSSHSRNKLNVKHGARPFSIQENSTKLDQKNQYSSNLLDVFSEKTDQLNRSCTKSQKSTFTMREIKGGSKKSTKVQRKLRFAAAQTKPLSIVELDTSAQNNSSCNVSPDSGIQSTSASPLYHNLNSPASAHSNFKSSIKMTSLSQKALLTACKKSPYHESDLKNHAHEPSVSGSSNTHPHNSKTSSGNFDFLKVPPYHGSKVENSGTSTNFSRSISSEFKEKRGPGRPKKRVIMKTRNKRHSGSIYSGRSPNATFLKAPTKSFIPDLKMKSKYPGPVVICLENPTKGKKKRNPKLPTHVNINGTIVPVIHAGKDWLQKPKKKKNRDKTFSSVQLKDIDNLTETFKKKCTIDSKKSINDSRLHDSQTIRLHRVKEKGKKRKVTEKEPELENNTSIPVPVHNDLKPKRKHKKSSSETTKLHDAVDQRLPLKKRHYHVSTSTTGNNSQHVNNETKKSSSLKEIPLKMDTSEVNQFSENAKFSNKAGLRLDSVAEVAKPCGKIESPKHSNKTDKSSKIDGSRRGEDSKSKETITDVSVSGQFHKIEEDANVNNNLRRSNRATSYVNKTAVQPAASKSESISDSVPKTEFSSERSAKKTAMQNILKSSKRVDTTKTSSKSNTMPCEKPKCLKNSEEMKYKGESACSNVDSNTPPTLSSIHSEKMKKNGKNCNSDTPPTLSAFCPQEPTTTISASTCAAVSIPAIVQSPNKPQLITPLPSEPCVEKVTRNLKPPIGVFEPSRKLQTCLSKCKRNSIDDVLSKLKEKLEVLNTPMKNATSLMEKVNNVKTYQAEMPVERVLRPKRSCTEKESTHDSTPAKKIKGAAETSMKKSITKSEEPEKMKSNTDADRELSCKPRMKRRKTNKTGFPVNKKKKKLKKDEPVQHSVISIATEEESQSLTNTTSECVEVNRCSDQLELPAPTIVKMESEEANEKCDNTESRTSELPPVLTAMKEIDPPTVKLFDYILNEKMNPKKTNMDSNKASTFRSCPSRFSVRISQLRDNESNKEDDKQVDSKNKNISANTREKSKEKCINGASKLESDEKKQQTKKKKKLQDCASKSSENVNKKIAAKMEVDKDEISDDANKKDTLPKYKRKHLLAGLFSDYYKGDKEPGSDQKKIEDHPYGFLPPPPYFEDWVRRRQVDFKLPFELWWLHTHNKLPGRDVIESWKYKKIKMNVYYDVKPPNVYETQACNCQLPSDKSKQGCGDDCINRIVFAECSPDLCPLKEKCSNQRIQKHNANNLKLTRFMTEDKGIGVKTEKPIKSGDYIVEYLGEVVTDKEFKNRMTTMYKNDVHHYCLSLDGGLVIDSHRMGGDGRFVNHSCEPNCEIQKWNVNGLFRMALFAQRDIEAGEELTYDYNFALFNPEEGQPCRCGSSKCRGVIGGKSQRITLPLPSSTVSVADVHFSNNSCTATHNVSNLSRKSRLRPRKRVGKKTGNSKSVDGSGNQKVRDANAVENVMPRRTTPSVTPVDQLTADETNIVREATIFLIRNLTKIRSVREKLRHMLENKESQNSNKNGKSKLSLQFSKLLNAFSKQIFIKTRGIAQAEDNPEITKNLKLANVFRSIFNEIVTVKDDRDERPFSSAFRTLPSKEKEPSYYRRIENPIDLNTIEKNIVNGVYTDVLSFDKDIHRLIANNIKFYVRTSENGIAAARLKRAYNAAKEKFIPQIVEITGTPIPPAFMPAENEEDVIRCICGLFNDEGLMILCERCYVWQHCGCVGANSTVEHYLCERCVPREVNYEIPLDVEPPKLPSPNEKHFLTLMRDDLQIRQSDTVYVLRDIPNPETGTRHTFRTIEKFKYEDCDIFRVEQLWKTEKDEKFAFGHHYLRPHETYHEPTRKFFPNEVVKISLYETVPLDLIMGRCHVLDAKTFSKGRPIDADPDHIYICEYRVDSAAKSFFKLPKSKATSVCTKSYAFHTFDVPLKPSRTYAPHGDIRPSISTASANTQKSRPNKSNKENNENNGENASMDSPACSVKDDEDMVSKVKDAQVEKRKLNLNNILVKLLSKKPTKSPLDASYLLDMGRRNRKKLSSGNVT